MMTSFEKMNIVYHNNPFDYLGCKVGAEGRTVLTPYTEEDPKHYIASVFNEDEFIGFVFHLERLIKVAPWVTFKGRQLAYKMGKRNG